MNCDCKEINEIVETFNFAALEEQINKCEECAYKKEKYATEQQKKTYDKVRLNYVRTFWQKHLQK